MNNREGVRKRIQAIRKRDEEFCNSVASINGKKKEKCKLFIPGYVRRFTVQTIPESILGVIIASYLIPLTKEPSSNSGYGSFSPCPRCGATANIKNERMTEWASMNGDAGGYKVCYCMDCGYWQGHRWSDD